MLKLAKMFFGIIAALALLGNAALAQDSRDIIVGSENAYKPFAYLDAKNQPTGFDNDVIKAVVAYIPNAKLQFVPVPWNVIFTGLDSHKFHIIVNQITKNAEREEKY
ncbi:MAG: transporter substrate-binding domain-containing protein, partial [Helicobacter sp.]|nr:transporter substrate-binding domain-containing protein [Helicobacter sp.]